MIVVVPCGRAKLGRRAPAQDFYTGAIFRGSLAYARSVQSDPSIFVISAYYGLIKLTIHIEPYEQFMTAEPTPEFVAMIGDQARAYGVAGRPVLCLAPGPYKRALEQAFDTVIDPFESLDDARFGFRLRAMKHNKGKLPQQMREIVGL